MRGAEQDSVANRGPARIPACPAPRRYPGPSLEGPAAHLRHSTADGERRDSEYPGSRRPHVNADDRAL